MGVRPGDSDTICALATAPGVGAIAVVRLSGARSLEIARRVASFLPSPTMSHRAYFGTLVARTNDRADESRPLDEALVTYFADGKSFTGEESVEFSVHGGSLISGKLIEELVGLGARVAKPGEFTYRAFMNDRIDLVQAESVLSLIESRSGQGSLNALSQLKGELSQKFARIEDDLVWMGAHIEASIDFSSDGLELKASKELLECANKLRAEVSALLLTYAKGRILRDGLTVALVGAPNAGKSSLLNAIVQEDRSIVTDQPGTTRDLIEVETRLEGTPVRWIDTAGLREAQDLAEKMGVERSRSALKAADFAVVVIDISNSDFLGVFDSFTPENEMASKAPPWFVFNKVDLDRADSLRAKVLKEAESRGLLDRVLFVSAAKNQGVEELKASVLAPLREAAFAQGGVAITQARHVEGLKTIVTAVDKAISLIQKDVSPELTALELKVAVQAVHELLGKVFHEQVIDRVFKEFCLGK